MSKAKKTRPRVWFDETADYLGRLGTTSSEEFTDVKAKQALTAITETPDRSCHCRVQCLHDRVQFKKTSFFGAKPPKKFHPYRDILHFYVFSSKPTIVVVCIRESPYQKCYFECIQFKDSADTNKFCDLLLESRADPVYELHEKNQQENFKFRPMPNRDEVSVSRRENASPVMDRYVSSDMRYTPARPHSSEQSTPRMPPARHYDPATIPRTEEFIYTPRLGRPETSTPLSSASGMKRALSNPHLDEDAWAVDVKYIDTHPKYGSRISENGPVYMFIAHHLAPERRAYSAFSSHSNSPADTPHVMRPASAFGRGVTSPSGYTTYGTRQADRPPTTYTTVK